MDSLIIIVFKNFVLDWVFSKLVLLVKKVIKNVGVKVGLFLIVNVIYVFMIGIIKVNFRFLILVII